MIWLNGALVTAAEARIDPADRGFTLGDGIFETLLIRGGVPLQAGSHWRRLREGAALLGIACAWGDAALLAAVVAVARAAGLVEAACRVTLTRGPAARGVLPVAADSPTLMVTAGPLPLRLPPARVVLAGCTRRNEASPLSRIKSLNYLDAILARQEAASLGADDALMLNTSGALAEATAANVFLRLDGKWVTPPVADGALPGIRRGLWLAAGVAVEASVSTADLTRVTAGLLTNALGVRGLLSIDGKNLAAVQPELPAHLLD